MKFDVTMMNPPYNKQKTGNERGAGGGQAIWQNFVLMAIDHLDVDGYLIAIHPDTWRECYEDPTMKIGKAKNKRLVYQKLITERNLVELHIMQNKAFSDIGISVDWYIFKNNYNGDPTIFFPNGSEYKGKIVGPISEINPDSLTNSILNKVLGDKDYNNGIFLREWGGGLKILNENRKRGKYKFAHGSRWITPKNEWMIEQYPHIHQFKNKVILREIGWPYAKFFSASEEIGIGDHVHYFLVNNKNFGMSLELFLNSKLILFLTKSVGVLGSISMCIISFWFYRRLKIKGIDNLRTNEDFYEHFKLTKEEINLIENGIKR